MNVFFHVVAAIGVTVLVTDTQKLNSTTSKWLYNAIAIVGFIFGVLFHGVLDFTPHCYPFAAKLDVGLGLCFIILLVRFTSSKYRIIVLLSLIGSVFPDLVDLSIPIANKLLGANLPVFKKLFPWHWPEYSGSIYNGNCVVSVWNHFLVVLIVVVLCWIRRTDFLQLFGSKK